MKTTSLFWLFSVLLIAGAAHFHYLTLSDTVEHDGVRYVLLGYFCAVATLYCIPLSQKLAYATGTAPAPRRGDYVLGAALLAALTLVMTIALARIYAHEIVKTTSLLVCVCALLTAGTWLRIAYYNRSSARRSKNQLTFLTVLRRHVRDAYMLDHEELAGVELNWAAEHMLGVSKNNPCTHSLEAYVVPRYKDRYLCRLYRSYTKRIGHDVVALTGDWVDEPTLPSQFTTKMSDGDFYTHRIWFFPIKSGKRVMVISTALKPIPPTLRASRRSPFQS